jgi:hypothetical protein
MTDAARWCSSYNRPMPHDVETLPATTGAAVLGLSTGGLFLEALARRDFTAMACCLAPTVRFRALLPRRDVDVIGWDATIAEFRRWFGNEAEAFEILDATVGEIGPRLYLRWRVRMSPLGRDHAGETRIVEQHAFATGGERLESLSLLCSGFVPG